MPRIDTYIVLIHSIGTRIEDGIHTYMSYDRTYLIGEVGVMSHGGILP
jgi:hypothetical protein